MRKVRGQFLMLLLWAIFTVVPTGMAEETEVDTWTSKTGASMTARLTGGEGLFVLLETPDGRQYHIELEMLDDASKQQALDRMEVLRAASAAQSKKDADDDETSSDGDGDVNLAVITPESFMDRNETLLRLFEFPTYNAAIYMPSGRLAIFLKDGSTVVAKPIRVDLGVYYYEPQPPPRSGHRWRNRRVVRHTQPPVIDRNTVHIRTERSHDVYSEVYYVIDADDIRVGYLRRDPPDIEYPSTSRINVRIPPVYRSRGEGDDELFFSPLHGDGITFAESRQRVSQFTGIFHIDSRRSRVLDYATSIPSLPGDLELIELGDDGVYGPRQVVVSNRRGTPRLTGRIYRGNALMQSFSIWARNENETGSPTVASRHLRISIK